MEPAASGAVGGVKMSATAQLLPRFIRTALQGLAFWVGHRQSLYRDYPLVEAAFVAEMCNLLFANLPDDLRLACEVQYKHLVPAGTSVAFGSARADLVIYRRGKAAKTVLNDPDDRQAPPPDEAKFVIEVKRGQASDVKIDEDLMWLSDLKMNADVRCFLVLVTELHRPTRFTNLNGTAKRGDCPIPQRPNNKFRVRRVLKASASFLKKEYAHYACIVEVL